MIVWSSCGVVATAAILAYCCVMGGRDEAGVVVTDEPTDASRPLPADIGRGRRWSMILRAPRFAPPPGWVPSVCAMSGCGALRRAGSRRARGRCWLPAYTLEDAPMRWPRAGRTAVARLCMVVDLGVEGRRRHG
ncbi:hypothetical protein D1007_39843 [Hordeum vulgare]|nr:hypothetical protein D1007_39843 [Hordeum vulgare]